MQPRRLSILGVGLLGGSIGLAVRQRLKNCHVIGYGHRSATLDAALEMGALDEAFDEPASAVRDADMVILCTPVSLLSPLLAQIAGALAPGTIVTDVGSTKRSVVETADKLLNPDAHFVGSHPMAGSEKRGVQFARPDLFERAVCITTPTHRTNQAALAKVENFWQLLGMRTTRLDPTEHDRLLADVSHLPHLLAAALVSMQDDAAFNLCGKGFLDVTRIAGGDAGLWRDILLDNRDNVRQSIKRLTEQLRELEVVLDANQSDALEAWLKAAADRRQKALERREGE
jgi:prephenate dehydrogenase